MGTTAMTDAIASIDALGGIAGVLTTAAFVPQVWRTWRSGSARDLSASWLFIFTAGIILWLIYGMALSAVPIILSNAVTFVLVGSLIAMKVGLVRAGGAR